MSDLENGGVRTMVHPVLRAAGFGNYVRIEMAVFADVDSLYDLPQREQFRALVESAVVKVWGSTWTTPEIREKIAIAALAVWDGYDAELSAATAAYTSDDDA